MADPDNGDAVFGDGDVLTITFDQATNRAAPHGDWDQAGVFLGPRGTTTRPYPGASFHTYPLGAAANAYDAATVGGRKGYVDERFESPDPGPDPDPRPDPNPDPDPDPDPNPNPNPQR